MDSNQTASALSNSPSGTKFSPPLDSEIHAFVKTNDSNSDTKPINNNSSSRSSISGSSDDGGFVSGEEEFETASEKPVVADPDEETLGNGNNGGNTDDVVVGSSEFLTPVTAMPMAVATVDDDVEKVPKIVFPGVNVEEDGVESFLGKPEIVVGPSSGDDSNLNQLVKESDLGVTQDGTVEVSGNKVVEILKLDEIANSEAEGSSVAGQDKKVIIPELDGIASAEVEGSSVAGEDKKVEITKLDEIASSEVEGSLVPREAEKVDISKLDEIASSEVEESLVPGEDKKSEALTVEDSVTSMEDKASAEGVEELSALSHDNNQISAEILEPADLKLVEADGVEFTDKGDSLVEAVDVNLLEPEVADVGEVEVKEDSGVKLINGSDQTVHNVENSRDVDFEGIIETSTNHKVEVEESEPSSVRESEQEADPVAKHNETMVKIAADRAEFVSIKDENKADGVDVVEFIEGFSGESFFLGKPSSEENSQDEVENHTDEEGDMEETDGETDGIIFGSSEAAKQFIEELEQGSGVGSHSGEQRIDGQIVTDSDEEVDTDEEGDGKELFDSAALAALLKAATGAGSDGGNITITSPDGSRLFSVERPAGLGSSASRSFKPATRPNRSNNFPISGPPTRGESESNLSEEEKKKLEKLQQIRVKFLRLVQRLGVSPEESVAAQVLYRLALVAGRQNSPTFSIDAAKRTAIQLEAEGKDDLDFSVNILVLGKSGVGKSATINSIFGEEKSSIDAFERATTSVKEISGMIDGVKVTVFDTPGLKSGVFEQSFNRRVLSSITKFTKKSPPDIVLYVDRLDSQTRDQNDLPLLKRITASLGPSIWRSAIVTLTHAACAPPDGPSGSPLSYEVFVTQRSHVVQQSIGHAVGDLRMMSPSLMNPVSLVENHPMCRKNREGQKVLPNGQTWRPQLLLLCYSMKILSEASSLSKPQDPFDHRKLFGFRVRSPPLPYMLSSMLQTRSHPKLTTDQGIDNGDSDVDVVDLSDSDQEEIDDYDQLPPFKPLSKAQIAMLSKEQKKAYFDEYDYRLKLFRQQQWREELKRIRQMKENAAKGGDAAKEPGREDAEQEEENAAPVATPLPEMVLPPSFDGDNPVYRYRMMEPTSNFLARPVLDSHGWDHDCGYEGVNIEQTLAIASQFPASVTFQITKDKKDFSIHLDSSVAAKHGENGSSMAGFDIQSMGKQLAYIVRGETKFKTWKKNKTGGGISVTFLGENIATGLKIEDQIAWGKQWALSGSAGTVRCQGDAAYGANFELQRRERDYPIGQVQSTFGLSLIKWRGDWALGFNTVAQFSIGRNSKVALRAGINNKRSGQITVRTSSSEHLSIALVALPTIANAIYKKIWPAAGENYSIY